MVLAVAIVCILLALLGAPLFVVFGTLASAGLRLGEGAEPEIIASIASDMYGKLTSSPVLSTIPLFTFAGYLLAESRAPQRLVNLARACFGWMPGGLALVTLLTCAFFTTFTGGSGVTIIAIGGLLYPVLKEDGYSEKFNLGLITSSGSIGLLFPPSLPVILYGTIASVDIDRLFLAGFAPGIFILIVLGAYCVYVGIKEKIPTRPFEVRTAMKALWEAKWEVPLPFFLIFMIYGGIITVAESAAVTALYVLVVECFILRDISLTKDLPRIIKESMTLVGAVFVILGVSLGFTNFLILEADVATKLVAFMKKFISSPVTFLLMLNVFLLIVGCLMDIFSAIVVVVPLIVPIAKQFGVDPVHLAIIFLANLEIGYLTPPVGMNLFISSYRFNKPIVLLYAAATPFILLLVVALLFITYVPAITIGMLTVLLKLLVRKAASGGASP